MKGESTRFGGSWTDEKLDCVGRYLVQYAKIMRRQRYRFAYIDAFAGTGYRATDEPDECATMLFPELFETETRKFLDGSASIALRSEPRFTEYIFIERRKTRCKELASLREEFPDKAADITIVQEDANSYLRRLCAERDWERHRAVLFLDPYGMQVEWETLASVGATHAIDLWLLFPLGVAVNRLLPKDGEIPESWIARLDGMFGTHAWHDAFYVTEAQPGLWGDVSQTRRTADVRRIGQYFVDRLGTEFAGVARNPLALYNSRNNPLFLLCFATANANAIGPALRIAEHILGKAG